MTVSKPQFSEHFPHVDFPLTLAPRYNIAPTQDVLVVRHMVGSLRAELVRWGMAVPSPAPGRSLINVRSETAAGRGLFRRLLEHDRVVLPASHFYEWRGRGRTRQPLMIRPREGMLAFAGLLGHWTDDRTGATLPAVAILTCAPNDLIRPIHDRMPVILDLDGWREWLDPATTADGAARLLAPCPEGSLEVLPVSRLVNDHRNDGPELLDPGVVPRPDELELPLFDEHGAR